MFDKLEQIEKRLIELEEALQDGGLYSDPKEAARILKEQKELLPVVEAWREYKACRSRMEEAAEMMNDEDPEMRAMAEEESEAARAELSELEMKIKKLLLPKDADDDKNVIIEIRGGVGGEEAALFAADLFRMYSMYAESKRYSTEVAYINQTELLGIKEVNFVVEGRGAWSRFKYEGGTHRVQRVPETESGGRIHTSAVTVAVLPEVEDVEIEINPADLQVDTFRSSGAGGQHVNKTESAIRITHLPTGVVVECQDERSQHKNRERAMKILRSKLYEAERRKAEEKRTGERRLQVGSGDRSERIRTYNFPQGRVTDHRIGLTLYKLDQVMNGALDELIDALNEAAEAERLKGDSPAE